MFRSFNRNIISMCTIKTNESYQNYINRTSKFPHFIPIDDKVSHMLYKHWNIMNNTLEYHDEDTLRHGICLHMKMFVTTLCISFHKNWMCLFVFLVDSIYLQILCKIHCTTCHSVIHITWIFPECFLNRI